MAVYKTTSSKTIIRKVMRDLNPNNDNWIQDAIEWMGEALEHIGSAAQLETKGCILDIVDYKASLPSCFNLAMAASLAFFKIRPIGFL